MGSGEGESARGAGRGVTGPHQIRTGVMGRDVVGLGALGRGAVFVDDVVVGVDGAGVVAVGVVGVGVVGVGVVGGEFWVDDGEIGSGRSVDANGRRRRRIGRKRIPHSRRLTRRCKGSK